MRAFDCSIAIYCLTVLLENIDLFNTVNNFSQKRALPPLLYNSTKMECYCFLVVIGRIFIMACSDTFQYNFL